MRIYKYGSLEIHKCAPSKSYAHDACKFVVRNKFNYHHGYHY